MPLFISYSRGDSAFVEKLIHDLQQQQIQIWIDRLGLKAGTSDWEQALRDAIHHSTGVVLVASPDSRRSQYVRDEIAIAQMEQKPIYPIWVNGSQWMDSIPMGMGHVQFIDLRGEHYAQGLQELVIALNGQSSVPENRTTLPASFTPRNPDTAHGCAGKFKGG